MNSRVNVWCAAVIAVAALGSCPSIASAQPRAAADRAGGSHAVAPANTGRVIAIDPIRTRPQGSGVGAVAGGVVGGLLGNKLLGGTAATAIGAVGGAVAGNNLERNHREGVAGYHVRVRLDRGGSRTIDEAHVGDLRVGDRVRIDRDRLHRL